MAAWEEHFDTEDSAFALERKILDCTILTPYVAMHSMITKAVNFLKSLNISSRYILDPGIYQQLRVAVMSVDSSQGSTATITSAAVPPDVAMWSSFVKEPLCLDVVLSTLQNYVHTSAELWT